ncbi:unnamed protein product [Rhizophagus irregularis]|nr:unnamed protein product [Rhizophagus irregularis]
MFSNTFTQINKPHFVVYIFEVKLSLIFRRIIELNTLSKYYTKESEIGKKVLKLQRDFKKEGMMEFESIGLHHLKETSSTIQPALKRKLNEKEMIIDSGNNPFYVSEHGKDPKNATNQKIEKQNSSSELPSSDVGPEDNDEIIGRSVRSMYRKDLKSDILEKAKTYELKWSDFHEVLALSSIIVLRLPCPYPAHIFTSREWQTIIHENPYIVADSVKSAFSRDHPFIHHKASHPLNVKYYLPERQTLFLSSDSEIGRAVSRIFNMCSSVPDVAPTKTSEDEHFVKNEKWSRIKRNVNKSRRFGGIILKHSALYGTRGTHQ